MEQDKSKETPQEVQYGKEDVKEFFRSILGNRPFEKVYSFLDDKLQITFRTLTTKQTNVLSTSIKKFFNDSEEDSKESDIEASIQTRLCFYISSITIDGVEHPYSIPDAIIDVKEEYNRRFGDFQDPVMFPAVKALMHFQGLVSYAQGEMAGNF